MLFANKKIAKITASLTNSKNKISIDGVTTANDLTLENAAAQINKILATVNKSVSSKGMTRTITQEGVDNG